MTQSLSDEEAYLCQPPPLTLLLLSISPCALSRERALSLSRSLASPLSRMLSFSLALFLTLLLSLPLTPSLCPSLSLSLFSLRTPSISIAAWGLMVCMCVCLFWCGCGCTVCVSRGQSVCVYACVCVRERQRDRESASFCVSVCAWERETVCVVICALCACLGMHGCVAAVLQQCCSTVEACFIISAALFQKIFATMQSRRHLLESCLLT